MLGGVFTGLRLAGLASAAAVAIAFVLIVRSLPRTDGRAGRGASLGAVATSGPSATATLPIIWPTTEPSTGPSPSESFTCSGSQVVQATTATVAQISDVRVGTHPGYDRIVFEFAGTDLPQLTVARAYPPFVGMAAARPSQCPAIPT